MALDIPELFTSVTTAQKKRFFPKSLQVKTFKNVGAAPLLVAGTPVAFESTTSLWVVWANAGTNETNIIRGFIWPDDVQIHATDEVLGQVLMEGKIHFADIVLPSGETQGNLETALKTGSNLRDKGILIYGLAGVR